MPYSNSFKKERMKEKVKWFLKLTPTERHKMAIDMLKFAKKRNMRRKHDPKLFKTIQVLKQK